MPKHPPEVIIQYLIRLDAFLSRSVRVVIIGGSAIALRWDNRHSTSDIDVLEQLDPELQKAIVAAGPEGAIPLQPVTISSQPHDYEDRLQQFEIPALNHLRVLLPDAHDLAIMKVARGLTHDLEGVDEIHRHTPMVLETLIERYRETDHIGHQEMFRLSFLALIARLFGNEMAENLNASL